MSSRSKRTVDVVRLSSSTVGRLVGQPIDFPIVAYGAMLRGGKRDHLVAYGGLVWRFANGVEDRPRCDIWLDVPDRRLARALRGTFARALVRWARRMIKVAQQMGETSVYCIRDDEPNSAKLLTLAGLERVDEIQMFLADGTQRPGEIWRWHSSRQS